ncbi:MAG: hypothetical protein V3V55_08835 [Rhodospirillales bacterium]
MQGRADRAAANARASLRAFIRDWRAIRARVAAGVAMDATEEDWRRYFHRLWSAYRRAQAGARLSADPRTAAPAHFFGQLQLLATGPVPPKRRNGRGGWKAARRPDNRCRKRARR